MHQPVCQFNPITGEYTHCLSYTREQGSSTDFSPVLARFAGTFKSIAVHLISAESHILTYIIIPPPVVESAQIQVDIHIILRVFSEQVFKSGKSMTRETSMWTLHLVVLVFVVL